jgi:DNA-3-methyladenine glycosylase I
LSITILRKREGRRAFYGFDPVKVAQMSEEDGAPDAGQQHRAQPAENTAPSVMHGIPAAAATAWQPLIVAMGTPDGGSLVNHWQSMADNRHVRAIGQHQSEQKAGMNFVGSTVIYAYLQATGVINDHLGLSPASTIPAGLKSGRTGIEYHGMQQPIGRMNGWARTHSSSWQNAIMPALNQLTHLLFRPRPFQRHQQPTTHDTGHAAARECPVAAG